MSKYAKRSFWAGVAERATKTAAQTALAVVTTGTVIWNMDWAQAAGLAATAVAVSVLTSLADPDRTDTSVATAEAAPGA